MSALPVVLLLLSAAFTAKAQDVPEFEPLLSSNTVTVNINERPQLGDLVLATQARGLGGETVLYGLELASTAEGVLAVDPLNGRLTVGPNGPERLVIVDNTPVLIVAEVFAYYNSSGSSEENRAYLIVNVEVLDINDPPDFGSETIEIPTSELTMIGDIIRRVAAVDHDLSLNGVVSYGLEQISPAGQTTFTLNQLTGDLMLQQTLDLQTTYQIRVTATDFGQPPESSSVLVTVQVAPVPPTFLQMVYTAEVLEFTSQTPQTLVTVEAADSSPHTPGTTIIYTVGTVIPSTTDVVFSVGSSSGLLTVRGTVDRETHSRYLVQIQAHENGYEDTPLGAGSATVVVTINDVNEPPEFLSTHYTAVVSEDASSGDTLFNTLRAVDYDEGTNSDLSYSISSVTGLQTQDGESVDITEPFFIIDTTDGTITVNVDLEREAVVDGYHYYELTLGVVDGGDPPLSDSTILTVTVRDINDNPPEFSLTSLSFSIPENEAEGSIVGEFIVTDRDQGSAAEMSFTLNGDFSERFRVVTASVMYSPDINAQPPVVTTGRVVTAEALDREDIDSYQLTLTASDRSLAPLSVSVPLSITVQEVNDNAPLFTSPVFNIAVSEDTNTTFIIQFTVTDADIGTNGEVDFSLPASAQDLFSLTTLGPFLAELRFAHSVDRETTESYSLAVFATDRGSQALTGETVVNITIGDVNDNAPMFSEDVYQATVVENTAAGPLLTTVSASDLDIGANGEFYYRAANQSQTLVFVNSTSGEVTLASPPDYEMGAIVNIQILAIDRGSTAMTDSTTLSLELEDVNDNAPVFSSDPLTVSVLEGVSEGTQFDTITATDADSGNFGTVTYSIISQPVEGLFEIDPDTGDLTVHEVLDRETDTTSYRLIVEARDGGNPSISARVNVDVEVADDNDNTPVFVDTPYITTVDEGFNESVGVFVYNVSATDADIGTNSQIVYSLSGRFSEFFTIGSSSGSIFVSDIGVDFEALGGNPVIVLTVIAADQGSPPRMTTTLINITVIDGNDNAPVFIGAPYQFSIPETNSTTRQLVFTVNASDLDQGPAGEVRYQLVDEGDAQFFEIDSATGDIYLPAGMYFDRESTSIPHNDDGDAVFRFGVSASDNGSPLQISFTSLSMLVTDVNDNSPVFASNMANITISEGLPVDTAVLNLVATDRDFGVNAQVNYTLLSQESLLGVVTDGFSFSVAADTGVVSLAMSLDRETVPGYILTVVATDQGLGNNQATVTVMVNVSDANDNRPVFNVPAGGYVAMVLENATVGTPVITVVATDLDQGIHQTISYSVLSNVTGTTAPFSFANPEVGVMSVSGALDRETLSEYQILIIATDSASNPDNELQAFATVHVVVTDVNDNAPIFDLPVFTASVAENTMTGTELTTTVSATDSDTSPFYYSIIDNNAPFMINSETGVVTTSGVIDYETNQEYSLALQVSDGVQSSNATLVIQVMDLNDNRPVFQANESLVLTFPESTPSLTELFVFLASDSDSGANADLQFFIDELNSFGLFDIREDSGALILNGEFDFEDESMYMLTVTAVDSGSPSLNTSLDFLIQVTDINDHPPVILDPGILSVSEESVAGEVVGSLSVQDEDIFSDFSFSIVSGDPSGVFAVNSSGVITVAGALDRESQAQYQLLIRVEDTPVSPMTDSRLVTVDVADVNDETPQFIGVPNPIPVLESVDKGIVVFTLEASDADAGNNSLLTFSIVSQLPEQHFIINERTGAIIVNSSLDRELIPSYQLVLSVSDAGSTPLSSMVNTTILVADVNDNTPTFLNTSYSVQVPEGNYTDLVLSSLGAVDRDEGPNAALSYSIISIIADGAPISVGSSLFSIDQFGAVAVTGVLDREQFGSYSLQIEVTDSGEQPRASQTLLVVTVADLNDNPPVFDLVSVPSQVTEGASPGTLVASVQATDIDTGLNAQFEYRLTTVLGQELFAIRPDGTIVVNGTIDYEVTPSITLTVEAINNQASVPMAGTITITVDVIDINDNAPMFQDGVEFGPYTVEENSNIGSSIGRLSASDADGGLNGLITFSVANQEVTPFGFSGSNLVVTGVVDWETRPFYTLIIEIADGGTPALSSQTTVNVTVTDVDDNLPQFESDPIEFTISEALTPGVPFATLTTTDRDSVEMAFYYIIGGQDESFVRVDSTSGALSLVTLVNFDGGQTSLEVFVAAVSSQSDPGSTCRVQTCTIGVLLITVEDANDNAPVFPLFAFSVNQSAPVDTVIGQVSASDVDTGEFGRVNFELLSNLELFSIGGEDGVIRLSTSFNASADNKVNRVIINAYDNPDNRLQSFNSQSETTVYFVEERDLVILILTNTLEEVIAFQGALESLLLNLGELAVRIFGMEEYTFDLVLSTPSPDETQKRQTIQLTRVNITLFAVNRTSQTILSSEQFNTELSSRVQEIITGSSPLTFGGIVLHPVPPVPPTPIPTETILLILYIVVGTLGGLVLFILLLFCIIFCCLNRYRKRQYVPGVSRKKYDQGRPPSTISNLSNKAAGKDAYDNPLWIDPYGKDTRWSEDPEQGQVPRRERGSEKPNKNRSNRDSTDSVDVRNSVLYESNDYVMANFVEDESDSDEEATVEIRPDAQSLSQQSTGDSTFERNRSMDRHPLVKKGRAWDDDDMRASAELELTATLDDDDEEDETGSEYTDDEEETGSEEEETEEETEEGSQEDSGESYESEEEYEEEDDDDFPASGFPELKENEFPLMF